MFARSLVLYALQIKIQFTVNAKHVCLHVTHRETDYFESNVNTNNIINVVNMFARIKSAC